MKKAVSNAVLLFTLFLVYTSPLFVDVTTANFLPPPGDLVQVYIRADGSVEPSTAPIQRFENVYVFIGNLLHYSLEVQCDNIVIDGSGFILQGYGAYWDSAIKLSNRTNVLIKNVDIRSYSRSVSLHQSSNNTITNNRMLTSWNVVLDSSSNNQIIQNNITGQETGYGYGVQVNSGSFNNSIIGNTFIDAGIGVEVYADCTTISNNYFIRGIESVQICSSHNIVSNNRMEDGRYGMAITGSGSFNSVFGNYISGKSKRAISIYMGNNNIIYQNHIANNSLGVQLGIDSKISGREVSYNSIYRNNFVNNTQNVFIGNTPSHNFWDNGEEGNFWGYNSERPYIINKDNRDNYPLMEPVEIPEPEIPEIPEFPSWIPLVLLFVTSAVTLTVYNRKLRKPRKVESLR